MDTELGGGFKQENVSSKWEYQKNATILELEARNRALQDRLKEAAEAPKLATSMGVGGKNTKDEADLEGLLASIRPAPRVVEHPVHLQYKEEAGIRVPGSQWEWHKNSALLELERRNQALQRQLDQFERASLEQKALLEQEQQMVQGLLQRESQNEVILRKAFAVKQRLLDRARAAVDDKTILVALGAWREATRHGRKKKALQKLLAIWKRGQLRRLFDAYQTGLCLLRSSRARKAAADGFLRQSLTKKAIFSWGSFVGRLRWEKEIMERVRSSRLRLTGRFVFGGWQEVSWRQVCKGQLKQRAIAWRRGALLRRGWLAWRMVQDSSAQRAAEADSLWCKHLFLRWRREAQLWRTLRSRTAQFASRRTARCLTGWLEVARSLKERKGRIESLHAVWKSRDQSGAMQGWLEITKRERGLRELCLQAQRRRAVRIQRWAWDVLRRQVAVREMRQSLESRRTGAIIRAWFIWCMERRRRRALVGRGLQRVRRRGLRQAFLAWKMLTDRSARAELEDSATRFSAKISRLEAGLSVAENAQSEALAWLEESQTERRTLLASAELASARTPVWSGGMLDAELRWRVADSFGGPGPRSGHSAIALFDDPDVIEATPRETVVFGGWNGAVWFEDALLFDSESQVWTDIVSEATRGPRGRCDHCACALPGKRMLVFGGFDGSEELADLHLLTPSEEGSTFEWSQPDLGIGARPGPLSHAATCLLPSNRHVALFGGYRSGSGLLNELWVLDLDRWEWSQPEVAGDVPRARRGHIMEAIGDSVIVHGGFDGQAHLDDLYVLDLPTMVWRKVDPVGDVPSARRGHAAAVIGRHVLIHGGFDGTDYLDDVYALDIDGFIWLQRAPMMSRPDHVALVEDLAGERCKLTEMDPNAAPGGRETRSRSDEGTGRKRRVSGAERKSGRGTSKERASVMSKTHARTTRTGALNGRGGLTGKTGPVPTLGRSTSGLPGASVSVGRAFHQAVFDGHRVVLIGGAHSHSALEGTFTLLLENAAVEDGRALARAHYAALEETYSLRNDCMRLERELAASRAEGSGFRAASERLAAALKVEAHAKKTALAAQRVLGRKLKEARAESAELQVEVSSLHEQLETATADCHVTHQHVTSAQEALRALEADHRNALFRATAAAQEERLRAAATVANLEALVAAREAEAQRRAGKIEALRAAQNAERGRVAELEEDVRQLRTLAVTAKEEADKKVQLASEEALATTRVLERRLQEQASGLERAVQTAREEATGQAEARAQSALQTEQQRAERLGERVRTIEKERGDERRFVETYRKERDAAEAARREAEAMRAEALEYARAMESRCREELARMEAKVRAAGLARWHADADREADTGNNASQGRRPVEVELDPSSVHTNGNRR